MASGGTPSTNRVFLFRLQTLIVDGGTLVLREMFDQRLPNVPLNVFLTNEKTSINRLRGKKTLTETQYDLLYPQSGQLPNSSDFDITLIICLLRNLKPLGLNCKYKWNATPQPADTSVEADLCRLKGFRNEVAHISSTFGIQPVSFQKKWTEIEQVLLRLNAAVPNPDPTLKQTIDSYKNDPLDPVAEQRIQKEIKKWRKLERGLETDILMVKKDVKELNQSFEKVKEIGKDVTKVSEEVKEVGKYVTKVSEEVKEVGKGVTKVSEDVKDVRKDITKVNEKVKKVEKDVTKVSEAVKEVGKDVTKVSEEVKGVGKDVTKVSAEVKDVGKDVKRVSEEVKEVGKDVTQVSEKVKEVGKDVTKVSEEVKGVGKDVTKVSAEVKDVGKDVKRVSEEVKEVGKDVTQVSEKVKEVGKDVTKVSEEVKDVGEDVTKVSGEVKEVGKDVTKVSGEVKEVEKDILKVREEVKEVAQGVSKVKESVTEVKEVKEDVKELKQHVDVLKKGFSKLETDVKGDAVLDSRVQKKPGILKRVKNLFSSGKLRRMKDLQDDLISYYRKQHGTISISPLIEKDTPVLEFYVMPEIYSVNVQQTRDGEKEQKLLVTSLRNVFNNNDKMCCKIYLTADAGLGKTALSKRLALTWCHAKKPHAEEEPFFSQEEIQAMNEFRFVFLLLLRDSSSECDIDDLILTQVMSQLPRRYTHEELETILFKERCLVILDGLDEWCHPSNSCKQKKSSIPHRKVREQTAVLTTTRPWKLSVSGLHSSEIDQKLELTGLNKKSANALKMSVISHLCADKNESEVQQDVEEFTRTLKEKQISDLETIPLLLMYLLFLWCNKIKLGQSQCEIYSQITELLLSRTVQNYQELSPKVDLHQDDIPQCLSQQTHCTQFYSLLKDLGQLAYQTLFRETIAENTLVFDSSVAELYLNKECLTFCLKTGIVTQSKVPGTLLPQKSKVSFAHKTVQEYFAALYIRSTSDQTSVQEIVLSKCTCVKDILEMSKILIFQSGFNVNVSSLISRELMKIINQDEITREYRSSLGESEPLKQFQDMCVSCCKELPHDTVVSFCLQDVFIDKSCQQEQYSENLKQLTSRNKQNIRSLYIDIGRSRSRSPYSSAQEVTEYFALSDLENIEKIHFKGEYNDRDILPLLKRQVQSLSCNTGSWSDLLYEKVTSLQNLEAIDIRLFKMSHEQLTLLYDYISHRHCMREIKLESLECSDHWRDSCTGYSLGSCTGCSLELSKHSQLRKIRLYSIPVLELNINMSSLEECRLQQLSNPDLVLRFINCVPADSKVNTFVCNDLKSSAAIETIQQTLPLLVHVKRVELWGINLGNKKLFTSEMVNLEWVILSGVTMPASVLRAIVTVLQQLTQAVAVAIQYCNVTPECEFVIVKEEIKQSSQFWGSEDSEDRRGKRFVFLKMAIKNKHY